MGNMQSFSFFPKSGLLYSGEATELDNIDIGGMYLASFEKHMSLPKDEFKASALAGGVGKSYKLLEVRPDLYNAQIAKKTMLHLKGKMRGAGQFSASLQKEFQDAYRKYQAAEVNGVNTNQLTIVQFVNQIVGKLEQPSFITTAFQNIGLDKLRGKIPEMGWPNVSIQVKRLTEPEIYDAQFGQNEFRIYRNDVDIYIPREDRMEATIDPYPINISQGQIQLMRARELLALKACSGLNYLGNGTYGELPDFTATTSGNVPHATNDGPKAFVKAFTGHFTTWKNYLKYFIWHPEDYRDYLSNWFSFAYARQDPPAAFGVVPMKGMEAYGCIAIISPYTPKGYVYGLVNEGAYELDGPYVVDSEYDAKKFADYNIVHDFIGYKIMHPKRFGEKFKITTSPSGTEITTDAQIYNLLKQPTDVVEKNSSA